MTCRRCGGTKFITYKIKDQTLKEKCPFCLCPLNEEEPNAKEEPNIKETAPVRDISLRDELIKISVAVSVLEDENLSLKQKLIEVKKQHDAMVEKARVAKAIIDAGEAAGMLSPVIQQLVMGSNLEILAAGEAEKEK